MKLIRFKYNDKISYGILKNNKILCLPQTSDQFPKSLEELITFNMEKLIKIEHSIRNFSEKELKKATYRLDQVELLAPIINPPKIICLGLNYRDHAAEQGAKIPDEPIIFMKPRTAIIGPNQPIIKPSFVEKLDYEGELAIIIGKRGKNIPVSKAKNYIFGYTIFNDVSARDIQFKDRQWTRGKSFDTFAPIGPCIVTRNQLKDPNNLRIRTWVNGQLRQNSTTRNMVFNVYETIYHISRVMTLEPGDIIATGTPAGVGVFMKPKPKFLKHGDIVEIEIEGIGKLKNQVIEEV